MKKKSNRSTLILIAVFLVGLSLLLYPSISNYWNSFHATRAIASYSETVEQMDDAQYDQMWNAARAYNQSLLTQANRYHMTDAQREEYEALLDVTGTGIMGYIEIPAIHVSLPVYHGVDEAVLQIAVGHIEGSSLPVGGESTHCVVSGHRGLPSAKLFTNLDELTEGDVFLFRVLDEVLTYEVDTVLIVEPEDVSALEIVEGEDLCTLVTCTPYGINTHRLLVQGHRIENLDPTFIQVAAEAVPIDPFLVAPLVAAPILAGLFLLVMVKYRKK
ncbi:MAG: class C sortase [Ruminiclostridium sp.]|nr:class C sortase [Ruminiclostridium sp.]